MKEQWNKKFTTNISVKFENGCIGFIAVCDDISIVVCLKYYFLGCHFKRESNYLCPLKNFDKMLIEHLQ
jgi:tRNA splicing ligase